MVSKKEAFETSFLSSLFIALFMFLMIYWIGFDGFYLIGVTSITVFVIAYMGMIR